MITLDNLNLIGGEWCREDWERYWNKLEIFWMTWHAGLQFSDHHIQMAILGNENLELHRRMSFAFTHYPCFVGLAQQHCLSLAITGFLTTFYCISEHPLLIGTSSFGRGSYFVCLWCSLYFKLTGFRFYIMTVIISTDLWRLAPQKHMPSWPMGFSLDLLSPESTTLALRLWWWPTLYLRNSIWRTLVKFR